jgi:hypothetical protein
VEADLLATATAYGVIGDGGLMDWYERKVATATEKVAASFDRLGMPTVAEAMRASLRVFPDGVPPGDLAARKRYLSANRARLEESFGPLDEAVWATDWTRRRWRSSMRTAPRSRASRPNTQPSASAVARPIRHTSSQAVTSAVNGSGSSTNGWWPLRSKQVLRGGSGGA